MPSAPRSRRVRRSDLFAKRRRLMEDWAEFCTSPPPAGAVLPLRKAAGNA